MSREALAACTRIAGSQHGVLSAAQSIAAGISPQARWRLLGIGAWVRVRPNVYALWTPSSDAEIWLQRLTAAALWLGNHSAVSHRAAALVWQVEGVKTAPIELCTMSRRRSSEPGLVIHRVRSLPAEDVVIRDGLHVTSPARTLIDLCAVVEPGVVELALESVLRSGMASPEQISFVLDRSGRSQRSRRVLGALLEGLQLVATESALEALVWRMLRDSGLPLPARQFAVLGARGELVARLDFAYPKYRFGIEADGYEFHSSRRDWQRDRSRQNALTQLGWKIYRITWGDATRRAGRIRSEITQLLSESSRSLEP